MLRLLARGNALAGFLGTVLAELVIERELARRPELTVPAIMVELAERELMQSQRLEDEQQLAVWLREHGRTREGLREELRGKLVREKLRVAVTEAELPAYFRDRAPFLETVVLSRIAVKTAAKARRIRSALDGGEPFEALARAHSIGAERKRGGFLGPVQRCELTAELEAGAAAAKIGEVFGPLRIEDAHAIFRVEERPECSLDDRATKDQLREELFQRWLGEKLERLEVILESEDR